MPDAADSLRNDTRYAIRFANADVWEAQLGINWLTRDLRGSRMADGTLYAGPLTFREVLDPTTLPELGDVDGDGDVDADDIDAMSTAIFQGTNELSFDLDRDGRADGADRTFLLRDVLRVPLGDANLDGVFDSSDLVQVFQAGAYGDNPLAAVGWSAGDWDGDGVFNSRDLVAAMQQGSYEPSGTAGVASVSVPEPRVTGWTFAWSLVGFRRLFQPLKSST